LAFAINIFRRFSRIREDQFYEWLGNASRGRATFDPVSAALMGKMICERKWNRSASMLTRFLINNNRSDLLPGVRECHSLLGWFESLELSWSGKLATDIKTETWWEAFLEVSIELYPRGLTEMSIWSRSGGDLSVLVTGQPGRTQWTDSLLKLNKGGGGKDITPDKLLAKMEDDYPFNEKLKILRKWLMRHKK
jgi:hypothetical protein